MRSLPPNWPESDNSSREIACPAFCAKAESNPVSAVVKWTEFIAAKQLAANDIEAAPAETDFAPVRIRGRSALQYVADTENQFPRFEGLSKIIVGALLQSVDAILWFGHCAQQQDRNAVLATQRARQLQPALARHHHIEDDKIEGEAR